MNSVPGKCGTTNTLLLPGSHLYLQCTSTNFSKISAASHTQKSIEQSFVILEWWPKGKVAPADVLIGHFQRWVIVSFLERQEFSKELPAPDWGGGGAGNPNDFLLSATKTHTVRFEPTYYGNSVRFGVKMLEMSSVLVLLYSEDLCGRSVDLSFLLNKMRPCLGRSLDLPKLKNKQGAYSRKEIPASALEMLSESRVDVTDDSALQENAGNTECGARWVFSSYQISLS